MTDANNPSPLRLRAVDAADLTVVAAVLQDALVPIMDMAFQPSESRFIFVINRFRWESKETPERVLCAVRLDRARTVRARGINRTDRGLILNLLSIALRDAVEGPRIALLFAGGGEIEIAVDGLSLTLEDVGEPWPAQSTPSHRDAEDT